MSSERADGRGGAWGALALIGCAMGIAIVLGYVLAPKGEPAAGLLPLAQESAAVIPEEKTAVHPQPKEAKTGVKAIGEAKSEAPPPETSKKNPYEAAGEVLGGLQIVATTDKISCEPGEAVTITWKLVNQLDAPVKYLDCRPGILVVKEGWKTREGLSGTWIAAGQNRQAQAEDLKEIAPRSSLTFSRTIEWPKPPERRAEGWPDFSEAGRYKVCVSFKTDGSIPMVAEQLKKEKGLDVYRQPLESGTLTITVRGEAPAHPSFQKTADTIEEDF